MKHGRTRACTAGVAVVALLAGIHAVPAAPPADGARLNRLIDVSGIRHSAQQVLPSILSSIDAPQPVKVAPHVRAALRDAATQSFQPDPIIERVRGRLGTALNARQLDDTLAWLDGALGRRITTMENEASDPGSFASVQAYGRDLAQRPPSKERTSLIREVERATGVAEIAAAFLEASALATALAVNASNPAAQQVSGEALRQRVKASLPEMRKKTESAVMLGLFYTYRTLPDQELEMYLKFLNSPGGVAYCKSANAAMNEAIQEATGRFVAAFPRMLEKHKGTRGT